MLTAAKPTGDSCVTIRTVAAEPASRAERHYIKCPEKYLADLGPPSSTPGFGLS